MDSGGWQDLAGEVMRSPVRVPAALPPTPQPTHLHYQSTNRTVRFTSTPKNEPSVSESPTQATTNYKIEVAKSFQSAGGSTSGLTDAQEVYFCMEIGCNVKFTGDDAEKAIFDHGRDVHHRFASLMYRVGQSTAKCGRRGRLFIRTKGTTRY
jgi:hypothetical protein